MRKLSLALVACAGTFLLALESPVFPVLKSTVTGVRQPGGFDLVPTQQLLKPWGEQTLLAGRPVDMTFDRERRILAVLNSRSVMLLDGLSGAKLGEVKTRSTSYTGIAF